MNKRVKTVYANLYIEPKFNSEMVNQSLYYDSVTILDQFNDWVLVKMYDKYKGWMHSFYLMNNLLDGIDFHTIKTKYSNNSSTILSFGTMLPIIEFQENKIKSYNPITKEEWYVVKKNDFVSKRDEIISYANQLIGVPYLWGGRTSFGLDCSGFIQIVLKVCGILFPRDTSEQIKCKKLVEINLKHALPGDVVFFSNNNIVSHVGFYSGNNEIIHSSGFVKEESFNSNKINFSKKLEEMFYKVFSIDKLINKV